MSGLQLFIGCAFLCSAFIAFKRQYRKDAHLPPSPPGHPLIGHILKFSPSRQYELFKAWALTYGDVFHLNVLGQSIVVVSSREVAIELLEKRSANYSDRPPCHAFELVGYEHNLAIMPYGEEFRRHRRMFQESFSSKEADFFRPIQLRHALSFLKRLLASPSEYQSLSQIFAMGIAIEIAYGHRVESEDDSFVRLVRAAVPALEELTAGVTLVDFIPFLARIPPWVPGAYTLAGVVHRWRALTQRMFETPFNDVLSQLAAGTAKTSFGAMQIQQLSQDGKSPSHDDLMNIQGAAGAILAAGMETTWSSLETIILALVLFPDSQRKAQEEIDSVVGYDRLPDFSDYDDLPFVQCLIQEVIRWHPVVPLGVPHVTTSEDTYNGMRIPARSMVIPNVQVMCKDSATYRDPDNFYPERFLPSPAGYGEPYFDTAFGFGRRICPGRHLAKDSLWIATATMLATFDISKAVGPDGKVIEPKVEYLTGGQTSAPKHFECLIKLRSERAAKLIMEVTLTA